MEPAEQYNENAVSKQNNVVLPDTFCAVTADLSSHGPYILKNRLRQQKLLTDNYGNNIAAQVNTIFRVNS